MGLWCFGEGSQRQLRRGIVLFRVSCFSSLDRKWQERRSSLKDTSDRKKRKKELMNGTNEKERVGVRSVDKLKKKNKRKSDKKGRRDGRASGRVFGGGGFWDGRACVGTASEKTVRRPRNNETKKERSTQLRSCRFFASVPLPFGQDKE